MWLRTPCATEETKIVIPGFAFPGLFCLVYRPKANKSFKSFSLRQKTGKWNKTVSTLVFLDLYQNFCGGLGRY
eukprot:5359956-Amphidinium_carterae.1